MPALGWPSLGFSATSALRHALTKLRNSVIVDEFRSQPRSRRCCSGETLILCVPAPSHRLFSRHSKTQHMSMQAYWLAQRLSPCDAPNNIRTATMNTQPQQTPSHKQNLEHKHWAHASNHTADQRTFFPPQTKTRQTLLIPLPHLTLFLLTVTRLAQILSRCDTPEHIMIGTINTQPRQSPNHKDNLEHKQWRKILTTCPLPNQPTNHPTKWPFTPTVQ